MKPKTSKIPQKQTTQRWRWLKWFDYVFVARPTLFFPVWTVFLAGFFSAGMAASNPSPDQATNGVSAPATDFLPVGIALTLLMGGIFVLNQIHDVSSDRANKKLFLVAEGHLSKNAAEKEARLLIGAGLLLGLTAGVTPLLLMVGLFAVAGLLYSVRPYSWKDRPLLGWVANAAGGLFIFTVGWSLQSGDMFEGVVRAVPYLFAISAVFLYTTLPDAHGDEASGKVTFSVRFGKKRTLQLGALLEVAALVGAYLTSDPILFYPALFTAPVFLWAVYTQEMRDILRAVKWSILLLALFVCVTWPAYFLVLVAVYFASKWYYRLRFGIQYPSLST
jgi:4-hydroxybenzoate polyprenyltransferase